MKIESLIRIIGGVLQNTPSILQIDGFYTKASKALRSSAFFDINTSLEDVQTALDNGAYAIISTKHYPIADDEIAWIYTEDLQKALLKLSRFLVQEKKIEILQLPKVYFSFLSFFRLHVKTKALKNSVVDAFLQINTAEENTLFLAQKSEFTSGASAQSEVDIGKKYPEQVFEKSLFISSFIYKNKYIQDFRLSSLFLPYICGLCDFFDSRKIAYELNNHAEGGHFQIQFVNEKLQAKEFGLSTKVLIFEADEELLLEEIAYLENSKFKDSTLLCCFSNKQIDSSLKQFHFSSFEEIKKLKDEAFRYALIFAKKEDFDTILEKQNHQQLTLL